MYERQRVVLPSVLSAGSVSISTHYITLCNARKHFSVRVTEPWINLNADVIDISVYLTKFDLSILRVHFKNQFFCLPEVSIA